MLEVKRNVHVKQNNECWNKAVLKNAIVGNGGMGCKKRNEKNIWILKEFWK